MPADALVEKELARYAETCQHELIETLKHLVRTPSENTPPTGAESACQEYCAEKLAEWGYAVDRFEPDSVEGIDKHPVYRRGRNYRNRPVIAGVRNGSGGGRSLILSGHIDTVPRGTLPWTRDPFGAEIESGRLYGRGANDMKAGIATNLFVARAVRELGLSLRGRLTVESVVDEEFGGVNGTLASRLRGHVADAAIISEPSSLRICPAQRGGRTVHLTFEVPNAGVLSTAMEAGAAGQVGWFLSQLPSFAEQRKASARRHPLYGHVENHVPVSVLKIHTGPWGMGEPMSTASTCKVELYWQTMPGEEVEAIDAEFQAWLRGVVESRPDLFPSMPAVSHPVDWLPASVTDAASPLVTEFGNCVRDALGAEPDVVGIEGPCDMFVFNKEFGVPALLWGVSGGNTHGADEYVDLDSVTAAAKALLLFVYRWCA